MNAKSDCRFQADTTYDLTFVCWSSLSWLTEHVHKNSQQGRPTERCFGRMCATLGHSAAYLATVWPEISNEQINCSWCLEHLSAKSKSCYNQKHDAKLQVDQPHLGDKVCYRVDDRHAIQLDACTVLIVHRKLRSQIEPVSLFCVLLLMPLHPSRASTDNFCMSDSSSWSCLHVHDAMACGHVIEICLPNSFCACPDAWHPDDANDKMSSWTLAGWAHEDCLCP